MFKNQKLKTGSIAEKNRIFVRYLRLLCAVVISAVPLMPSVVFAQQPSYEGSITKFQVRYSVKRSSLTQDYEVLINNKGVVVVSSNDYYTNPELPHIVKTGKLTAEEFADFKNFVINVGVFQFQNEYIANGNMVELSSERIKFVIGNKTKEIVVSSTTAPPKLRAIIQRIEELKSRIR